MKLFNARYYLGRYLSDPLVWLLARTSVSPTTITWFGFILAVVSGILIALNQPVIAAIVMLVGGMFDMLDGALARHQGRVSKSGAFLDSTLDRLSESALLLGVMALEAQIQSFWGVLLAGLALVGSLLVSYVRARAEALGLECKVGIFTRPERVIILALGLFFARFDHILLVALGIIVVFSFFTAGQRMVYVSKQAK